MTSQPSPAQSAPPPPTYQAAIDEYYNGEFERSIETLQQLLAINPYDVRARWEMVRLYEESGSYSEALGFLRDLNAYDPGNAAVREELFVAAVLAGKSAEAKSLVPPAGAESARALFYEGLLAMEEGNDGRAAGLFRKSLELGRSEPMAWYFLGRIEYAAHDYSAAVDSFRALLNQDPNLTIALVPLADAMLSAERYGEAYNLLRRAREVLPNNAAVVEKLASLEKRFPALSETRSSARAQKEEVAVPPRVAAVPAGVASSPIVRVGLAVGLKSITIKMGGSFTIRSEGSGDSRTYHGKGEELLRVGEDGGAITLSRPDGAPFLTWTSPVVLSYAEPDRTTIVFDLVTGSGEFYAATHDRAYRGQIIFRPGSRGFTVINRVPLEEYLYSVLPSEMPALWPMEALEAQAVAARSYTLASLGRFEKEGYDVQGSVISAAYGGVGSENPRATEAVNSTAGQILLFHGKPLEAFYSANSGGYTENSLAVWGQHAGMEAVPDALVQKRTRDISLEALIAWITSDPRAYDATPPFYAPSDYRWKKWVSSAEIARRLIESRQDVGTIESIISRGRGISGRVTEIEIKGTLGSARVKGDSIRWVLGGLRSNLFTSRPLEGKSGLPEYFIFRGAGWGHGVGMDQDGAAGMAAAGYNYRQILAHYYPRAELGVYLPETRTARSAGPSASAEEAAR